MDDSADRTRSRTRPHSDRHAVAFKMGHDLADRLLRDKANMRRHPLFAGHRRRAASGVQLDFLLPEMQRDASFAEALNLHAKHALIELNADGEIRDGQIQMVDALDLHG